MHVFVQMTKARYYQDNIRRSLREQWTHIDQLVNQLPEGLDLDYKELSKEHKSIVDQVKAIEEEWIVDPEVRASLTCLPEEQQQ